MQLTPLRWLLIIHLKLSTWQWQCKDGQRDGEAIHGEPQ